jgi:predicted Zn-dependent protease
MTSTDRPRWQFASRFRRGAYGWRSSATAVARIKEAVAEIRKVARKEPVLAAEGAIQFLQKVSPALQDVDSSSGALGNAVNRAIQELVPILAKAPVELRVREAWLNKLWEAHADDQVPYIEYLGDLWGELCAHKELAARWADETISFVEKSWSYREWGVKALIAMGKADEALQYAEASRGLNVSEEWIARAAEEIMFAAGRTDEAYQRYAFAANQGTTYLSTFRAIARKYPDKLPADILRDLISAHPGREGKWFAAAKDAGEYDLALELVQTSPADINTLLRAASDFKVSRPMFALGTAMASLRWILAGQGYDVTAVHVLAAASIIEEASERLRQRELAFEQLQSLLADYPHEQFVHNLLARLLNQARP